MKKFISPGGWFSLEYPSDWNEFENSEDTFLFYNPNLWNGNFRISATLGRNMEYGKACLNAELKENPTAVVSRIGKTGCVYSFETFQEGAAWYTSYFWMLDYGKICIECSFTTHKNGEKSIAEKIIQSIFVPKTKHFFAHEIIPIRILEVGEINAAFEAVEKMVKKELSKDFTGSEKDLVKLQHLLDSTNPKFQKAEIKEQIALAFGAILVNEMDGMDWNTLIEVDRECPVLCFENSSITIDPLSLIINKVKNSCTCDLTAEYNRIHQQVEEFLKS